MQENLSHIHLTAFPAVSFTLVLFLDILPQTPRALWGLSPTLTDNGVSSSLHA